MNIFFTDPCPVKSAQNLCDKHVVKMPLESAQMLCTAWRLRADPSSKDPDLWCDLQGFYKTAFQNHPSAKWTRACQGNYKWLYNHFVALCIEYQHRYDKVHGCFKLAKNLQYVPDEVAMYNFYAPPLCMPDEYKGKNAVTAYRDYIHGEKRHFAKWSKRKTPEWFIDRG
jgi:hypothetical protein